MLKHLSVTGLLTSVVAVMAGCVVIFLSINAWDSFGRLQTANRVSQVATASGHLFTAMHNLRTDRSNTARGLNGDAPILSADVPYFKGFRDREMTALRGALEILPSLDFPGQPAQLTELSKQFAMMSPSRRNPGTAWRSPSRPGVRRC